MINKKDIGKRKQLVECNTRHDRAQKRRGEGESYASVLHTGSTPPAPRTRDRSPSTISYNIPINF